MHMTLLYQLAIAAKQINPKASCLKQQPCIELTILRVGNIGSIQLGGSSGPIHAPSCFSCFSIWLNQNNWFLWIFIYCTYIQWWYSKYLATTLAEAWTSQVPLFGWITSLDAPCQVTVSPQFLGHQLVWGAEWRSLDNEREGLVR